MPEIEVLRELYEITERRDGAVFNTKYVKDVWVDPDALAPAGFVYVTKNDPDITTIRRKVRYFDV